MDAIDGVLLVIILLVIAIWKHGGEDNKTDDWP